MRICCIISMVKRRPDLLEIELSQYSDAELIKELKKKYPKIKFNDVMLNLVDVILPNTAENSREVIRNHPVLFRQDISKFLITKNKRDFKPVIDEINVLTLKEFLKEYGRG